MRTLGTILKKLFFGTLLFKYANTRVGVAHERDQSGPESQSNGIIFVFITSSFHSAFTFLHLLSYNWIENSQSYCFQDHNNFRCNFSTGSDIRSLRKLTKLFSLKNNFRWW